MSTLADKVTDAVYARKTDRISAEDGYDWSDNDAYQRYVQVLRTVSAWKQDEHTVVVSVAATHDGETWSYAASELLDHAADVADVPFDTARIDTVDKYTHKLTWV